MITVAQQPQLPSLAIPVASPLSEVPIIITPAAQPGPSPSAAASIAQNAPNAVASHSTVNMNNRLQAAAGIKQQKTSNNLNLKLILQGLDAKRGR